MPAWRMIGNVPCKNQYDLRRLVSAAEASTILLTGGTGWNLRSLTRVTRPSSARRRFLILWDF
jgi:molybdopterin biosynthesis enzyme MoaB